MEQRKIKYFYFFSTFMIKKTKYCQNMVKMNCMNKETSYRKVISEHVAKLGVSKGEVKSYFHVLHHYMAICGIITFESISAKRKKPYKNSPMGKFVDYDERGTHIDSFILSPKGAITLKNILTSCVTTPYLQNGLIPSTKESITNIQQKVINHELLECYLYCKGVQKENIKRDNLNDKELSFEFTYKGGKWTYHYDSNNIVSHYKVGVNGKRYTTQPFWYIAEMETNSVSNKEYMKNLYTKIYTSYWNLKLLNREAAYCWYEEKDKDTTNTTNTDNELLERIAKLEAMIQNNTTTTNKKSREKSPRTQILEEIYALGIKPMKEQNRYKTISQEVIDKETKRYRKERIQKAYDLLEARRLLQAKYKPVDGWKFDFNTSNIELLYRVDNRKPLVYNIRHRLINPIIKEDGKKLKEISTKSDRYFIPYGLEKIDYGFKTIFITEGCFDSCFLKNCLAYNCNILTNEMNKVIEIFRKHGYQIIHILDNFRLEEERGGRLALTTILRSKDWLQKGDLIYNWSNYPLCKDLNEVAIEYNLDEITTESIISNSWNEEEARDKGVEFITLT